MFRRDILPPLPADMQKEAEERKVAERRVERGKRNRATGNCSGILFREYVDHIFLTWAALFSLLVAVCSLGLLFESTEGNKNSFES
jgi:hypothetical protein